MYFLGPFLDGLVWVSFGNAWVGQNRVQGGFTGPGWSGFVQVGMGGIG